MTINFPTTHSCMCQPHKLRTWRLLWVLLSPMWAESESSVTATHAWKEERTSLVEMNLGFLCRSIVSSIIVLTSLLWEKKQIQSNVGSLIIWLWMEMLVTRWPLIPKPFTQIQLDKEQNSNKTATQQYYDIIITVYRVRPNVKCR